MALVLLCYILFKKVVPGISVKLFRPFPKDKLKNLLIVGLPAVGEQFSYNFSQVVITYFTVMLGTAAVAARAYAMNIVMFSYVFAAAIGQGAAISIGHFIGKDRDSAAYTVERYSIRLALGVTLVLSANLFASGVRDAFDPRNAGGKA